MRAIRARRFRTRVGRSFRFCSSEIFEGFRKDSIRMGPSCCEIQYTHEANEPHEQNITGGGSMSFYSYDYCFRADDLPPEATACTTMNKQCKTAQLVNLDRDAWPVSLCFNEVGTFYYIRGWRKFCADNKSRIGDVFGFNVVGDGITPPLICLFAPTKECFKIAKTWRRKLNLGPSSS